MQGRVANEEESKDAGRSLRWSKHDGIGRTGHWGLRGAGLVASGAIPGKCLCTNYLKRNAFQVESTRPWPITVDSCFPVGVQVLSAPLNRSCLARAGSIRIGACGHGALATLSDQSRLSIPIGA